MACAFLLVLVLAVDSAQGQLFSGPSGFSQAPSSQLGPVTNNLVLTDNANGFVVSGQVLVTVPAGLVAGTLVSWEVDRPLNSTFGSATMFTTTILDGFSAPPPGAFQQTGGSVQSYDTNFQGPSTSFIPMTLINGIAVWSNITVNSSSFAYTSGGTNFLRQRFDLDGVQLSGPGGTWTIDVPVTTIVTVVPEPSSIALGGMAAAALAGVVWRKRRKAIAA